MLARLLTSLCFLFALPPFPIVGATDLSALAAAVRALPAAAREAALRRLREAAAAGSAGGVARAPESLKLFCDGASPPPPPSLLELASSHALLASQARSGGGGGGGAARRARRARGSGAAARGRAGGVDAPPRGVSCACEHFECECTRACSCALLGDGGPLASAPGATLVRSPLEHADGVNASDLHNPAYMFRCDCRFDVDASAADFDGVACGCQRESCACTRKCACAPAAA
jgi:hypothetical protein